MSLLSSSVSVARYKVGGAVEGAIMETVHEGLKRHAMTTIEDEYAEITIGWTPFESDFEPDFEKYTFTFGNYFIFSMRIDKKGVPAKIIKKYMALEIAKKLKEDGRDFLSKNEKTDIKDAVTEKLMRQIPSTPNVYNVMWDHEKETVYFFSTQKAANEEFETLFARSFKVKLIKLFPFTMVELNDSYTNEDRDKVMNLTTLNFKGKIDA